MSTCEPVVPTSRVCLGPYSCLVSVRWHFPSNLADSLIPWHREKTCIIHKEAKIREMIRAVQLCLPFLSKHTDHLTTTHTDLVTLTRPTLETRLTSLTAFQTRSTSSSYHSTLLLIQWYIVKVRESRTDRSDQLLHTWGLYWSQWCRTQTLWGCQITQNYTFYVMFANNSCFKCQKWK